MDLVGGIVPLDVSGAIAVRANSPSSRAFQVFSAQKKLPWLAVAVALASAVTAAVQSPENPRPRLRAWSPLERKASEADCAESAPTPPRKHHVYWRTSAPSCSEYGKTARGFRRLAMVATACTSCQCTSAATHTPSGTWALGTQWVLSTSNRTVDVHTRCDMAEPLGTEACTWALSTASCKLGCQGVP